MDNVQYEFMDVEKYIKKTQNGPCFICEMISGNPDYEHHIVFENNICIAFLNKYPTLLGYTLVAPKIHKEHVTGNFTVDEYLAFQKIVYELAEAVRRIVPTERMYILSLGSQQGHRHLHWHIAPLPPNVPYEKQQTAALLLENGIITLSDQEMASLALKIRKEMNSTNSSSEHT